MNKKVRKIVTDYFLLIVPNRKRIQLRQRGLSRELQNRANKRGWSLASENPVLFRTCHQFQIIFLLFYHFFHYFRFPVFLDWRAGVSFFFTSSPTNSKDSPSGKGGHSPLGQQLFRNPSVFRVDYGSLYAISKVDNDRSISMKASLRT